VVLSWGKPPFQNVRILVGRFKPNKQESGSKYGKDENSIARHEIDLVTGEFARILPKSAAISALTTTREIF
jgi:hypothetical protein